MCWCACRSSPVDLQLGSGTKSFAECEHAACLRLQVIVSPFAAGQQDTKPAEDDSENESAISRTESELREVQQAERALSEPQQSEVGLLTAGRCPAQLLHGATLACTAWQWAPMRSHVAALHRCCVLQASVLHLRATHEAPLL